MNIREAIRKVIKEGSITDANNVTADTFSHASNAQIENSNAIFTGENLDKLDELVDAVHNLTINDAKYYESNTVTVSDAQDDLTRNLETITYTCNGNFEQRLLSYWTIPVLPPEMNPGIDQYIASTLLTIQTLLAPVTKEIAVDAVSGGACIHRTPR